MTRLNWDDARRFRPRPERRPVPNLGAVTAKRKRFVDAQRDRLKREAAERRSDGQREPVA